MARSVISGRDFTFVIPLDGPLQVADSVTWTLRDQTGAVKSTAKPSLAAGAKVISIMISAATNTKSSATLTESRFLEVSWASAEGTQIFELPYVLVDWIPLRVQASDVMSILGLDEVELSQTEIDIMSSALFVKDDVGSLVFDVALVAGDLSTNRINQLVAVHAAIELAPSLQLRVADTIKTDTVMFQRYRGLNIENYIADLWLLYGRVRGDLMPDAPITQPVLLAFSAHNRDPMVGAQCHVYPNWLPNFPLH